MMNFFTRKQRAPEVTELSVFVSKPSALNRRQGQFCEQIQAMVRAEGLVPRTVDSTNVAPLMTVKQTLQTCRGALVLGLRQLHVETGVDKAGTKKRRSVNNEYLPTPWNQIEAGMAFMLGSPVMLIGEADIRGGVFDPGMSDRFVHQAVLSTEWLKSDQFGRSFTAWVEEVKEWKNSAERLADQFSGYH
jgi:hypothetical protein